MGRAIIRGVRASVSSRTRLRWVAPALLPVINLVLALLLSAAVVRLIGESPARALWLLASGAFGSAEAVGYTLYYATNFVFTGLAVAVAFHGGLFNIGAEGQAYIGGLAASSRYSGGGGRPAPPAGAGPAGMAGARGAVRGVLSPLPPGPAGT